MLALVLGYSLLREWGKPEEVGVQLRNLKDLNVKMRWPKDQPAHSTEPHD
jgi:hypothetical protein